MKKINNSDELELGCQTRIRRRSNIMRWKIVKGYVKGKILDVGCGDCRHPKMIKIVDENYTGIDISDYFIKMAKEKGINVLKSDAQTINLKDKFDTVIALEVLEHLKNPEEMLKGINKVLNKDGIAILSTPNLRMIIGGNKCPFHINLFNYEDFKKLFGEYFEIIGEWGVFSSRLDIFPEFFMRFYEKVIPMKYQSDIMLIGKKSSK